MQRDRLEKIQNALYRISVRAKTMKYGQRVKNANTVQLNEKHFCYKYKMHDYEITADLAN